METKLPANIPAWFAEFFKRFALKSPKFFQVLQTAGTIAVIVGFVPDILVWMDITTTPIVSNYISLALKVAGAITWINAKLPVTNSTTVVTHAPEAMPFTAKKKIEGAEPSPQTTQAQLDKNYSST